MAKVINGTVYFNTVEATEIANISRQMVVNLIQEGWFDEKDIYIEPKRERKFYYLSLNAIEKLKKRYGERKHPHI